ncbi:hypothetical protein PoHVEF18_000451 [Penicillium ochrochloron]
MPPTLYVIRHAQGDHNVNVQRTIQTAAYTFAPELEKRQIPMVLVPKAQEISSLACDIGHDAEVTISEAPKLIADAAPLWDASYLDTTLVNESWNSKKGIYASSLSAVHQRAAEMRNWIYNRPERHIALVTHGGFLHYFTEDWTGYVKGKEFTEDSNEEESHLRECGSTQEKQARPAGLDAHLIHEIDEVEKAS